MAIKNLAIIPARAGSKGLKGKNTQPLGDKALIAWTIEAALEAQCFDRIVVSSDIPEMPSIVESYDDPHLMFMERPKRLATDKVPILPVLIDTLTEAEFIDCCVYTNIYCLQPTSPLRSAEDILRARTIYERAKAYSLLSVKEERHSLWRIAKSKVVEVFAPTKNRQDLSPYYTGNGAITITKRHVLLSGKRYAPKIALYPMGERNSVDIHTKEDLDLAKYYLTKKG